MTNNPTSRRENGTFQKGHSGNLKGRPKGSTNHDAELQRAEDWALELVANVSDAIKEAAREALTKAGDPEIIPLIVTITNAAKKMAQEGEIGPSRVASLRGWYDDNGEEKDTEFIIHVGLPPDCSWESFRDHYKTHGRIDFERLGEDLLSFPPIAAGIQEAQEQAA